MPSRFFTNHGDQTLLKKFQGVFSNNPDIEWFDALVGFLRASGYFAIRPHLEKVPHIRILVGINVDAIMADYHRRGLLFLADPTKALQEFRGELRADIQGAAYRQEVEAGILQFVEDVISRKIELRAHPTKRLHAKLYIFRPRGFNEHKPGAVITGSSNLTAAGIGVDENTRNYEFNVLLHDFDDVQYATGEFERLWAESVEILPRFLTEVRDSTYLAATVTPYELYFKLLLEYFGASIEYDPNALTDMPEGFKRLSYQVDAVTSGFRLLEKHGGFFLADVVGLGKTIVAILIAKKFYFHNGFPEHRSHTLIVVPPAMEDSWRETIHAFRLDNTEIITNGSLHKVRRPERFDLIIVDEAHKFRNDTADAFDELQRLCKSPTQRHLPDGTRAAKKVILVSATPLNNRPDDIRNLLSLFQDLKDSTLSVANLQRFFFQREKEYREAKAQPDVEEARRQVKAIYETIRTKVISEVIVRRTRTDLVEEILPGCQRGASNDTFGQCWDRIVAMADKKPRNVYREKPTLVKLRAAIKEFNESLEAFLPELQDHANRLLAEFAPWTTMELSWSGAAHYNPSKHSNKFSHGSICLRMRDRGGSPLQKPSEFLNEARVTAIGLCLYLAGMARSILPRRADGSTYPRLLVLDDVLLSLDMVHRLPLLRVLRDHFKDWQVFLLTHDRAWYEIAKQQLEGWSHHELFTVRVGDYEQPILREDQDHLYWALEFLEHGHVKAAAVHLRTKFELVLKWACHSLGLAVRYHPETHKVPAADFWAALKSATIEFAPPAGVRRLPDGSVRWWQNKADKERVVTPALEKRIEHAVSWVLNPLSHSQTLDRHRSEIEDAVFAVDELETAVRKAICLQKAGPVMLREMLLSLLRGGRAPGPSASTEREADAPVTAP